MTYEPKSKETGHLFARVKTTRYKDKAIFLPAERADGIRRMAASYISFMRENPDMITIELPFDAAAAGVEIREFMCPTEHAAHMAEGEQLRWTHLLDQTDMYHITPAVMRIERKTIGLEDVFKVLLLIEDAFAFEDRSADVKTFDVLLYTVRMMRESHGDRGMGE